jgi:hypothetical protein
VFCLECPTDSVWLVFDGGDDDGGDGGVTFRFFLFLLGLRMGAMDSQLFFFFFFFVPGADIVSVSHEPLPEGCRSPPHQLLWPLCVRSQFFTATKIFDTNETGEGKFDLGLHFQRAHPTVAGVIAFRSRRWQKQDDGRLLTHRSQGAEPTEETAGVPGDMISPQALTWWCTPSALREAEASESL